MKGRWRIISKGLKNKLMQKGKDANIYQILTFIDSIFSVRIYD